MAAERVHPQVQTNGGPGGPRTRNQSFNPGRFIRKRRPDYTAVNLFVKYLLFISNFLFMIAGAAFTAGGIYVLVQKNKTVNSFIDFIFDPACDICLVGCIIFVVAFFGCGGALRESIVFLRIYYIVLMILFLLEFVGVIFVFVFYFVDGAFAKIGLYPEDAFLDAVEKYRDDPDMQGFIDNIQKTLSCCGASNDNKGYLDWNKNVYFKCAPENKSPEACMVPFSCCIIKEGDPINYRCGAGMLNKTADLSGINADGCLKGVQNLLQNNIWIVGGTILGILIPQAVFIFFAKQLVAQIRTQISKW